MDRILIIDSKYPEEGILKNALKDRYNLDFSEYSNDLSKVKGSFLIMIFWRGGRIEMESRIRGLRAECGFKDIPIIVISGKGNQGDAQRSLTWGASSLLFLPISINEVRGAVDRYKRPIGKKQKLNVEIINPFINATVDVLEKMAGIKVKRKDVFLKRDYRMFGDVSGIMGLSGEAEGSVAITFTEPLARRVISRMLQLKPEDLTQEYIRDGVGELINMISGSAKTSLVDTKYHFQISLPTIIIGAGHELGHKSNTPCLVIVFEAEGEEFAVQISLKSKEE